jgi:urease accessory protein UreF
LNLFVEVPHLSLVGIGIGSFPLGAFVFSFGLFVSLLRRRSM